MHPTDPHASIDEGTRLAGRYQLRQRLAAGGAGDVWLAHDEFLERPVAAKVLRQDASEDQQRFDREIHAQAPLTHPSIVRIFDAGAHRGYPYIVMAYVEGRSLADHLTDGPLPPEELARFGHQLADALAHAHSRGVVHRDVKPSNVLLDADGRAHLTDFGIARHRDSAHLTASGAFVGTASYVAPEQVGGEEVTGAADVYALGLVLLEALTGRREYPGGDIAAAVARLHRDPEIPDDLSEPWTHLLPAMLARDPADRPTGAMVAARLDPHAPSRAGSETEQLTTVSPPADGHPTERGEGAAEPAPRRARPRPWRWLAAAAAVAVALAVAGVLLPRLGEEAPPGDEPPAAGEPESLDEAADRLEEAIQP